MLITIGVGLIATTSLMFNIVAYEKIKDMHNRLKFIETDVIKSSEKINEIDNEIKLNKEDLKKHITDDNERIFWKIAFTPIKYI